MRLVYPKSAQLSTASLRCYNGRMLKRVALTLSHALRSYINDPVRGFQLSILTLFVIILFATSVYMRLEGMSFVDALYMTLITISTVGFGEVHPLSPGGRIFTMFLILLGVGFVATTISNAIGIVLGPRLWLSIRQRTMERVLMSIENHYVVCGYGRMGQQIVDDLRARGEPFVLIESDPERAEGLLEDNIPFVIGDATADETLLEAGIERASGLVAAVDSDSDNVMIVLTARELNPKLFIVARVTSGENENKLRRAGANRVVSPYQIGGHRLALALLRPAVSDFLDKIFSFHADIDMEIGQIYLREGSRLAGQTVASCELRNTHSVSILAIQKPNKEVIVTPSPAHQLELGSTLIIIGPPDTIYELEKEFQRGE